MRGRSALGSTVAAALALGGVVGCADEAPLVPPRPVAGGYGFEYPTSLWDSGVEGETVVLVHVDEEGAVDSVTVAESSGHAAMDSSAVGGARAMRFLPGSRGGRAVATWARVPVRFSRQPPGPAEGG